MYAIYVISRAVQGYGRARNPRLLRDGQAPMVDERGFLLF